MVVLMSSPVEMLGKLTCERLAREENTECVIGGKHGGLKYNTGERESSLCLSLGVVYRLYKLIGKTLHNYLKLLFIITSIRYHRL